MSSRSFSHLSLQLFLTDLALIPIGLEIATRLRVLLPFGQDIPAGSERLPLPVYLFAAFLWILALVMSGAYEPSKVLRWYAEASRLLYASLLATILLAGALYFTFREVSRLQFFYSLVLNLSFLLGNRALLRVYYRLRGHARPGGHVRVLIAGAGELGQRVANVVLDHSRWGLSLIGYLDDDRGKQGRIFAGGRVLGRILDVKEIVESRGVNELWIALPVWAYDRINLILSELEKTPVRIKVVPDYFSLALVRARAEVFGGIPVIALREPLIEGFPRLVKRAFDLVIGGLLFIFSLPFMALIALAIRLDSPGPIFFHQQRVGENGRIFEMLKFRTMVQNAEELTEAVVEETDEGAVIHKKPDDPRVTKVGRFLRHYSLDELPQLWNVLRGEMSLVGPRPEMPWLVDRYDSWQRKRFAVPQGITGWWQINGRSDKPMHLNTEDDLYYVYNYSLWLDIQILLRTPWVVLRGKGAF